MALALAARRVDVVRRHLSDDEGPRRQPREYELLESRRCSSSLSSSSADSGGGETDVVVVGGIICDVLAEPSGGLRSGGSTPGSVRVVQGGVGANVAAAILAVNMATAPRSSAAPLLITMVGDDVLGSSLVGDWALMGMPTRGIVRSDRARTATLVSIFGNDGEVAMSVADVASLETNFTINTYVHHYCLRRGWGRGAHQLQKLHRIVMTCALRDCGAGHDCPFHVSAVEESKQNCLRSRRARVRCHQFSSVYVIPCPDRRLTSRRSL